jgi:hypothetical protein
MMMSVLRGRRLSPRAPAGPRPSGRELGGGERPSPVCGAAPRRQRDAVAAGRGQHAPVATGGDHAAAVISAGPASTATSNLLPRRPLRSGRARARAASTPFRHQLAERLSRLIRIAGQFGDEDAR